MSFLEVKNIQGIEKISFNGSLALSIIKIENIPPHLTLICDDEEFHLTLDGAVHTIGLAKRERVISLRKMQCLFFEIELNNDVAGIKSSLKEIINSYKGVNGWEVSCLEPIKDFFKQQYQIDVSDVSFVFELIPKLEAKGLVKNRYHKNLAGKITDGTFKFKTYTKQDIVDYINTIKLVNA